MIGKEIVINVLYAREIILRSQNIFLRIKLCDTLWIEYVYYTYTIADLENLNIFYHY